MKLMGRSIAMKKLKVITFREFFIYWLGCFKEAYSFSSECASFIYYRIDPI